MGCCQKGAMLSTLRIPLLALLVAALPCALPAQEPSTAAPGKADPQADPRAEIASKIPGTKPEELHTTPIPGVYELLHGADIAYVSTDGKYAITGGDLIDIAKNDDLTEQHRREARAKLIASVPESEMVIFGPKDPKYTVTVFTDVDCGYCRKLHSQIADYNRMGVRVRYLFYPRTGPNTESWTKAEQVWCSANRNEALTRAKLGQTLDAKPCANNPVARTYELGRDFNLEGTPAIVLASGEMFPGYVPPDVLVQHLKQSEHR